ncbi:hypothetical protein EDD16DRAFT_1628689 [Pisolithus croceorrhizus]|nr:hypothetical protein EDD16DRAFT_1628689 [Pisolithus croceorrhizus]KAI6116718.1 hypothetical protein EV401DRAFT_43880 [Pisolithus croceorrhizus]KAI6160396.1 hypothetical protein EDD17DRAFT_1602958 [Pisolithus thermaeus]
MTRYRRQRKRPEKLSLLLLIWGGSRTSRGSLNGPVIFLFSVTSKRKDQGALRASIFKLAGGDVLVSWKILICLGVAPFSYTLYAKLVTATTTKMWCPRACRIRCDVHMYYL